MAMSKNGQIGLGLRGVAGSLAAIGGLSPAPAQGLPPNPERIEGTLPHGSTHGPGGVVGDLIGHILGSIFADDEIEHHCADPSDRHVCCDGDREDPPEGYVCCDEGREDPSEGHVCCDEHEACESHARDNGTRDGIDPERARSGPEGSEPVRESRRRGASDVVNDAASGILVLPPDLLFDPGVSDVSPGAASRLRRFAEAIRERSDLEVVLHGHADTLEGAGDAVGLSERRAESVRAFLANEGVPFFRIRIVGLGTERPVASNDSAVGRQRNRRVEFSIRQRG